MVALALEDVVEIITGCVLGVTVLVLSVDDIAALVCTTEGFVVLVLSVDGFTVVALSVDGLTEVVVLRVDDFAADVETGLHPLWHPCDTWQ